MKVAQGSSSSIDIPRFQVVAKTWALALSQTPDATCSRESMPIAELTKPVKACEVAENPAVVDSPLNS
ncbi:hypothetical protein D3C81_2087510 [compost metagenome]